MCSCMEHVCHVCGCQWFDNNCGGLCPDCDSGIVSHHFDEAPYEEEGDLVLDEVQYDEDNNGEDD